MCTKGMIGFLPLLATSKLGMNTAQIGVAVSLHFGFGMFAKPLMGILYNRWGARAALFWPMTLLGVFVFALPFMQWETGFYILSALTGVVGFVSPIILTAAADFSERDILTSSVGFHLHLPRLEFSRPLVGRVARRAGKSGCELFLFCDHGLAGRFGIGAVERQKTKTRQPEERDDMTREYFKGAWQEDRSFSPAVKTRGGEQIWMAGVGVWRDDEGNVLAGDFDAQVHATFRQMERTLERAGGKLQDIVTMTVFTLNVQYGGRFVELRKQYFPNGYPGSALITVAGFAKPENDGRNTGHRRRGRGIGKVQREQNPIFAASGKGC